MHRSGQVRVGCSGWNYRDWRGCFYPAGLPQRRWFEHYASVFDTVEINCTFYGVPSESTVAAWRAKAPDSFLYTVKANRLLTHRKRLRNVEEIVRGFLERMRGLGSRLGPILYQLPPRWECDPQRLEAFLALLPPDLVHVFEFRDRSWLNDRILALLDRFGASICAHDMAGSATPRLAVGPVAYVRFHGTAPRYAGRYHPSTLRSWARWLDEQAASRAVFAHFNNDVGGQAVRDAQTLRRVLRRRRPP